MQLAGKVALITGSSRGLGKAMALTFARAGADIVVVARTEEENPKLPGTIHQTADEVRALGRRAVAIRTDVLVDEQIEGAVARAVAELGRLDIVVHDAGAAFRGALAATSSRRWDVLHGINLRASFILLKAALPHLQAAGGGHFLTVSPPVITNGELHGQGIADDLSKQAATLLIVNAARELADWNIAANCLWPASGRATEGMRVLNFQPLSTMKSPQLFADAALAIVGKDPKAFTGRAVTDEELLAAEGVTDFARYAVAE